ncbi:uncharacterized protein I303_104416 [Kwoniella dejecticola CBS 10117]|uniref:Glycosyltransferase n=1 Tax=Kwoniella dejecticola CBS 10117 TaxID=1296121 RepID=A0A1A6A5D7_9TREE|nr:glycosyltransferase [Kwoniella dejecticola CBS 10117]OBR85272.1 glycosyltransferase [Kwoniella dejecticola CBS 10117]
MFLLSSIRARISILLITVPLLSLLLYSRLSQPNIEYSFPRDVLRDYTSPSTQCYWPDQDGFSRSSQAQGRGSAAKLKEWIGFGVGVGSAKGPGQGENGDPSEESLLEPEMEDELKWEWEGVLPDIIPASGIEKYMLSHIEDLQEGYDPQHDFEEYGLKLGNISLEGYTRELLSTYKKYLIPSNSNNPVPPTYLPPVLSRLSLRPPIAPLPPRPKQVLTTDKSIDSLPWQFDRWKEIMPEWNIKYFDDASLKAWVHHAFGSTKAEKIWLDLPRQVLKTDIFRYMAMLVEGGIYTDSDTAPIIHADQWGIPYHHETAPLLTHLSRLLSLTTSQHLPSSHPLSSFAPQHATHSIEGIPGADFPNGRSRIYDGPLVDDGNELGEPALVVSVESDAIDFGWTNWREVGLSRAVQITQWTFMARPGHPVFLDALGRTLRRSKEMSERLEEAKAKGEEENFVPETALEWTGPGVFSDCVYRYLLARYGFKPQDLIHKKEPIRVGDVLILPAGSYSSVSPFTDEEQRPWAASYHGFLGRWRDADPAVQEFERLKKLKEEADKAEEEAKQAEAGNTKGEEEAESLKENESTEDDGIPRGTIGDVPLSPIG